MNLDTENTRVVEDTAYRVGEQVEYHSSTFEWIDAVVRATHVDGTIDLDVKDHADPGRVRRRVAESLPTALMRLPPAPAPYRVLRGMHAIHQFTLCLVYL